LDEAQLSNLLSLTCRVQTIVSESLGFAQSMRPAPSAGAIHPIHVVLNGIHEPGWHRYDPFAHSLVELKSRVTVATVRDAFEIVLPVAGATLILFAAEPDRMFAKYCEGSSLVWRDAGVLQGYFAAAAEALELNFCLLGVTGEPWVSQLVDGANLVGAGAAYVGTAP
jgi:SagB-type dehydrogenase family enzyme